MDLDGLWARHLEALQRAEAPPSPGFDIVCDRAFLLVRTPDRLEFNEPLHDFLLARHQEGLKVRLLSREVLILGLGDSWSASTIDGRLYPVIHANDLKRKRPGVFIADEIHFKPVTFWGAEDVIPPDLLRAHRSEKQETVLSAPMPAPAPA